MVQPPQAAESSACRNIRQDKSLLAPAQVPEGHRKIAQRFIAWDESL
jgi:hypothetical protein